MSVNRTIVFREMNLGNNFSHKLSEIIHIDRHRFSLLNLSKNNLGDSGVKILMHEICRSQSLVHLNLSSNEISNEGMIKIFKGLSDNESLISLNLSTVDGVARNRISYSGI